MVINVVIHIMTSNLQIWYWYSGIRAHVPKHLLKLLKHPTGFRGGWFGWELSQTKP